MRKADIIIIAAFILVIGCEENFSPKEEFEKQYIANCIIGIGGDQSKFGATVHLANTYDLTGLNPELNQVDPTITEADVQLSFPHINEHTLMPDTSIFYHPFIPDSIIWADYNRYGNPFISFTASGILVRHSPLQLDVELTNGKKLSASTELPRGVFLDYNYDYPHGFTTRVNTWKYGDYWEITWDAVEGSMYYVTLTLNYFIETDSANNYRSVELPIDIKDGKEVFPKFNYPGKVRYSFNAVTKKFESISEGIEDKSKIYIVDMRLTVTELNKDLSSYYSSLNGFFDEYSVRLDEQIYSNINGGIGIFGAYKNTSVKHFVDGIFVDSFGYRKY